MSTTEQGAPVTDPDAHPYYGLAPERSYPTKDSLLVYWDSGTLPEPSANITPADSDQFKQTCDQVYEKVRGLRSVENERSSGAPDIWNAWY